MEPVYASCHCQEHILKINVSPEELVGKASVCNCSHCLKRRMLWAFVSEDAVEYVRGATLAAGIKEYSFGGRNLDYKFCGDCGTILYASSIKFSFFALNLRAVRHDEVDVFFLQPVKLSARATVGSPYDHPELEDIVGAKAFLDDRLQDPLNQGKKVFIGGCHCKANTFAFVHSSLQDLEVWDCACSICLGNGNLWCDPGRSNVFFHPHAEGKPHEASPDTSVEYRFGQGLNRHWLCRACGCHLYEYRRLGDEQVLPGKEPKKQTEEDNGLNGSFGLNFMLLNEAGQCLSEIFNLDEEQVKGQDGQVKLKDFSRGASWRDVGGRYKVAL